MHTTSLDAIRPNTLAMYQNADEPMENYGVVECLQIPYLCISSLIFCAICFTLGGVATNSVQHFFEFWIILCEYAASITFFGIFLAMLTPNAQVCSLSTQIAVWSFHEWKYRFFSSQSSLTGWLTKHMNVQICLCFKYVYVAIMKGFLKVLKITISCIPRP